MIDLTSVKEVTEYIEELEHKLKVAEILTEEAQSHVRAVNLRLYELLGLEPDEVSFKWAALAVKEAVEKAKRYDYLKSLATEEVSKKWPRVSEFCSVRTDWVLNITMPCYADFHGTIPFDEAVDIAIQKSSSQQPKIPV